jgi:GT2 family glycosyltransferase
MSATPGDKRLASLSVVIPTFNRAALLIESLDLCVPALHGLEVEFVVVDDGSSDDTSERLEALAKSFPAPLRHTKVPNGGPGQARNVGAAMARNEVILFIGDDIRPADENFFRVHAELHGSHPGDDLAVLGKIVWPDRPDQRVSFVMAHIQGRGGQQFGFAHMSPYSDVDWRFFYTSNISIKRTAVADWERDGFSHAFHIYGYEDIEFAYRLSKRPQGLRIFYTPAAKAIHIHPYSVDKFINRQMSAGMMANVFIDLHPEVADMIGVGGVKRALERPGHPDDDTVVADYGAMVEGVKAWARVLESQHDIGSVHWHEMLISAVFNLCYLQGFIVGWNRADANLAMAYRHALERFSADMAQACHNEVVGGLLDPAKLMPWNRPGHLPSPRKVSALRAWARRQPVLVTVYRRLRGL